MLHGQTTNIRSVSVNQRQPHEAASDCVASQGALVQTDLQWRLRQAHDTSTSTSATQATLLCSQPAAHWNGRASRAGQNTAACGITTTAQQMQYRSTLVFLGFNSLATLQHSQVALRGPLEALPYTAAPWAGPSKPVSTGSPQGAFAAITIRDKQTHPV